MSNQHEGNRTLSHPDCQKCDQLKESLDRCRVENGNLRLEIMALKKELGLQYANAGPF
jgi:regulator of replication initiation timing